MPIYLNILLCYYAKTSRICAMDIYKAFTQLNSKNQASNFLTDLCTPNELKALEERWEVAKLLATNKYTYREISAKLGATQRSYKMNLSNMQRYIAEARLWTKFVPII